MRTDEESWSPTEDEVSTTANSQNDGTSDVPNNAGVSATCCFKIVSLNVCGLMSKMKYPEFREMLVLILFA